MEVGGAGTKEVGVSSEGGGAAWNIEIRSISTWVTRSSGELYAGGGGGGGGGDKR